MSAEPLSFTVHQEIADPGEVWPDGSKARYFLIAGPVEGPLEGYGWDMPVDETHADFFVRDLQVGMIVRWRNAEGEIIGEGKTVPVNPPDA